MRCGLWLDPNSQPNLRAITSSACTLPLAHFLKKPVPLCLSLYLTKLTVLAVLFIYFNNAIDLVTVTRTQPDAKPSPSPNPIPESKNSFFLFFFVSLFLLTSQINSGVIKCVLSPESVSKGKRKQESFKHVRCQTGSSS